MHATWRRGAATTETWTRRNLPIKHHPIVSVALRRAAMLAASSTLRCARVSIARSTARPRAAGNSPRILLPAAKAPAGQTRLLAHARAVKEHSAAASAPLPAHNSEAHRQPPTLPTHLVTAPPFLMFLANKAGKGAYACGEAMSRFGKNPEPGCPYDKPDHSGPLRKSVSCARACAEEGQRTAIVELGLPQGRNGAAFGFRRARARKTGGRDDQRARVVGGAAAQLASVRASKRVWAYESMSSVPAANVSASLAVRGAAHLRRWCTASLRSCGQTSQHATPIMRHARISQSERSNVKVVLRLERASLGERSRCHALTQLRRVLGRQKRG